MSINFRTLLTNAKTELANLEQKVDTGIVDITLSATNIVDKFANLVQNATTIEPVVIADLESPFVTEIASLLPNGTTYLNEIIAVLNRVAPYLKNAVGDATIFNGALHHLAAEITSILDGSVKTIDEYIDDVQQLFLPATT
jgi:hypothetical protein